MKLLLTVAALSACVHAYTPLENLEIGITSEPATCDKAIQIGDTIDAHYTGKLRESGTEFDSSHNRQQPLRFTVGVGQVIPGWDQGLLGMCVGEKRRLQIPSKLAYGAREIPGVIPANSDLLFDVELVSII